MIDEVDLESEFLESLEIKADVASILSSVEEGRE